jgi:hypothetical protein
VRWRSEIERDRRRAIGCDTIDAAMMTGPDATFLPDERGAPSYGGFPCPGPVKTSDILPWKAPVQSAGACTQSDVAAITTLLDKEHGDIRRLVQCARLRRLQAVRACYASAFGGSAAWGNAIEEEQQCLDQACSPGQCNPPADMGCVNAAEVGACQQYHAAVGPACGAEQSTLDAECKGVLQMTDVLCVSGPGDVGSSDSGAD